MNELSLIKQLNEPIIIIKDTNIKFLDSKTNHTAELNGLIKIRDFYDSFEIKEAYNYKKKKF